MFHTDPIELATVVVAAGWLLFSTYSILRAHRIWTATAKEPDESLRYLRSVAMRRVRVQGFHLITVGLTFVGCVATLSLDVGELQSTVRNMIIIIFCAHGFFRSAIDHWEQRTTDARRP